MIRSQPFTVTEWDWFQIQLRVLYLELRGPNFVRTFQFRAGKNLDSFAGLGLEDDIQLLCNLYCSTTSELVKKKESREKQLEFYSGWVKSTKAKIEEVLNQLPALRREFSVERNAAFVILDDYGTGSVEVCRFVGDKVLWPVEHKRN